MTLSTLPNPALIAHEFLSAVHKMIISYRLLREYSSQRSILRYFALIISTTHSKTSLCYPEVSTFSSNDLRIVSLENFTCYCETYSNSENYKDSINVEIQITNQVSALRRTIFKGGSSRKQYLPSPVNLCNRIIVITDFSQ